jgi:hypothetical protein
VRRSASSKRIGSSGAGKRRLEEENEQLRLQMTSLLGLDPAALTAEAARLHEHLQNLRAEQTSVETQLAGQRA